MPLLFALCSVALGLGLFLAPFAHAHDPFETTSVISLHRDRIELRMIAARATVEELFGAGALVRGAQPRQLERLYELSSDGHPLELRRVATSEGVEGEAAGDRVFDFEFAPASGEEVLVRAVYLEKLEQGYTGVVQVVDVEREEQVDVKVLHSSDPFLEVQLLPGLEQAAAAGQSPKARQRPLSTFLWMGLEHVVLGYDHLLFLLCVLACVRARQVLAVLTTFTLAHSVTLSLAALHLIPLVSAFVEPVIALSIAVAAFWGTRLEAQGLLLPMTFAFGLIHGLGFAAGLQSLAEAGNVRVVGLVGFNLGVELGQVAVALTLIPAIGWCRKRAMGQFAFDWTARAVGAVGGALFLWRLVDFG